MRKNSPRKHRGSKEGDYKDAIGDLPYGSMDAVITSPLIDNKKQDTYLSEMLKAYRACFSVLTPNGLMVLVVKPFIRNKAIVPLDEHTIKLCEAVGFILRERHYRLLTQQSFWRTIYRQRYPLAPVIDREHILIFVKC